MFLSAETDMNQSAIPAGFDISTYFAKKKRADTDRFRRLRLVGDVDEMVVPDARSFVYVYNLPFRVNDEVIRNALASSIGTPDEITIYDVRGATAMANPSVPTNWEDYHLASPLNALIRFSSIDQYSKACLLENKLFGVLCKASVVKPKQEKSRMMFLEPADRKRLLLFTGFGNLTLSAFRSVLEERLARIGITGQVEVSSKGDKKTDPESEDLTGTIVSMKFPSFPIALHAFRNLQADPIVSGVLPAFMCTRTRWSPERRTFEEGDALPRVLDPLVSVRNSR